MNIDRLFIKRNVSFDFYDVDLFSASDDNLQDISDKMGLALSKEEMKNIKNYFQRKKRIPTDIELEALGQAWSEHCCYKSSKIPLKQHIYGIEEDKIVAREDAGVIEFDDDHYYVITGETHNSPSNMEAYGGAITGIVGVYRDPMGTGKGSKLVMGMYGYCVGPRDYRGGLKPHLHPRRLLDGVIEGVRDGGNKSGIPTPYGHVWFHEGYRVEKPIYPALSLLPEDFDALNYVRYF